MPDEDNKQSVALSKEQYFALMKVVYLGNWIANAHRDGKPGSELDKEIEGVENLILSYAKQFGFGKYVDDELASSGQFFPTRLFDETSGVEEFIDAYDDEYFWEELIDRLAERDFHRLYNRAQIRAMSESERYEKLFEFTEKWSKEFEKHGLNDITLKKGRG